MSHRDEYGMIVHREEKEPQPKLPPKPLRDDARARAIRLAMRRLRAQRRAAGLNAQGKPLNPVNIKFINKKWRKRYATKPN